MDYKRHGTASLYATFDILTGLVIGRITQRHSAKEFLAFLREIDRATPADLDLHVILDISSTHKHRPSSNGWRSTRVSNFISRRPVLRA